MRKVFACLAPLLLAATILCGCSVSEMSTLRELSRPYTGEYECEKLTYAGRDLLGDYEYIRLTLEYGDEAALRWKDHAGGEGGFALSYEAEIEEGIRKKLRMNGLVNSNLEVIRHMDREIEKESDVIPVALKDGQEDVVLSSTDGALRRLRMVRQPMSSVLKLR